MVCKRFRSACARRQIGEALLPQTPPEYFCQDKGQRISNDGK